MTKVLHIGGFEKLWDEEGVARGLEANGVTVVRMDERSFDFDNYRATIANEKPDILLFAKLKIPTSKRQLVIDYAKENAVTTVCWMPDLYWGLSREYRIKVDPMFKADYVFTPDGGERDWGKVNHRTLRQAIPDKYCFMVDKEPGDSVVFVGSTNPEYPYRWQLIKTLGKRYPDKFEWYGRNNSDEVRGTALNDLYARAGVVMGESVYAPFYWSNRIYETLGRGGFLVHPNVPGLKDEYEPYEHFIPYRHGEYEELFEIIDYYLKHPEKRKKIREAAYEHTKKHHTMSVRCKQFLELLRTPHNN